MDAIEKEIQAKGLTAPRVTPADIEAAIASEHYFTALQGCAGQELLDEADEVDVPDCLALLTFCVLVMRNGFTVTGQSACASPENFDAELGRKIARQDAIRQCWPLLGFELRSKLAAIAQLTIQPPAPPKRTAPYTWKDVDLYDLAKDHPAAVADRFEFRARMRDGAEFHGWIELRSPGDDRQALLVAECNKQAGLA